MARAGQVTVDAKTVTELTNANVSGNITFQHRGGVTALVMGTTGTTAPSEADIIKDGVEYQSGDGEAGRTLDDIFPGASFVRLWAYSVGGAYFIVYHA